MRRYQRLNFATAVRKAVPGPAKALSDEQIERLKSVSDILLGILSVAGILTVAVMAPNAFSALDLFEKKRGKRKLEHEEKVRKVSRAFYYLKQKSYVEFRRKGKDDFEVTLTDEGKKQIRRLNLDTVIIKKPLSWDGKFWQVAADIPTKKYRRGADALRAKLKEMKFYALQRTLWFYPYDPRIELEFVARSYGVESFVTTMKIEKLDPEDETAIKGFFRRNGII